MKPGFTTSTPSGGAMDPSNIQRYPVTIDGETTSIGTANELAVALDVLQGQHDRAVLEQLGPALAGITGGPLGLKRLLPSLAPEDQIYLVDALGPRLADIIQEARHLRDVFAGLAFVEVELTILDTLGSDGLRAIINTAEELAEVLDWLYGECDRRAIELLGPPYLTSLIRSGSDLCVVLEALGADAQLDILDRLGWAHTALLLRDGSDLAHLLRALPADLSTRLLAELTREQLVVLIGNRKDWQYLWERLEPEECRLLADKLGVTYAA
jgi:hypothetical protein